MEIELQYLYRSAEPPPVPAELAGFRLTGSSTFEIVDTYYDTVDLGLRRAGCSLRIRVQTNLPDPLLTWKGPAERRSDGAKARDEVELALPQVPADGVDVAAELARLELTERVAAAGLDPVAALARLGELRNRRTAHDYDRGADRLELVWDRLAYPVGPPELRLELEVKRGGAECALGAAAAELEARYGDRLARAAWGKSSELARRLRPEAFAIDR